MCILCVCIHICMCVYIYIYRERERCMYIYIYICIYIYTYTYTYIIDFLVCMRPGGDRRLEVRSPPKPLPDAPDETKAARTKYEWIS